MDNRDSRPINIPDDVLEDIYHQARQEFPNECCGWLIGPREGNEIIRARRATNSYSPQSHPTAGNRTAETAYEITGQDLLELNRTLDDPEPPRVIYHSHPNGMAYFSETDQAIARDPWGEGPAYPVQQLVIGIDDSRVVEARLFGWDDAEGMYVEIARLSGKDI